MTFSAAAVSAQRPIYASQHADMLGAGRAGGVRPPEGFNQALHCHNITTTLIPGHHGFTAWMIFFMDTKSFWNVLYTETTDDALRRLKDKICHVTKTFLHQGYFDADQLSDLFTKCLRTAVVGMKFHKQMVQEIAEQGSVSSETMNALITEASDQKDGVFGVQEYMTNFLKIFDPQGMEFYTMKLPRQFHGTLKKYAGHHFFEQELSRTLVFLRSEEWNPTSAASFFPSPELMITALKVSYADMKVVDLVYHLRRVIVVQRSVEGRGDEYETYLFQPDGAIFKYLTCHVGTEQPQLIQLEAIVEDFAALDLIYSKSDASTQGAEKGLEDVVKGLCIQGSLFLYEKIE